MKKIILRKLRQLLCEHNYCLVAQYAFGENGIGGEIDFYECRRCHSRFAVVDIPINRCLGESLAKRIKLWKRGQYELTDNDVTWRADGTALTRSHLERSLKQGI